VTACLQEGGGGGETLSPSAVTTHHNLSHCLSHTWYHLQK